MTYKSIVQVSKEFPVKNNHSLWLLIMAVVAYERFDGLFSLYLINTLNDNPNVITYSQYPIYGGKLM